jgi:ATP-binding cassette subfamily B protein
MDRGQRTRLLGEARGWWTDATLLCVTHDVGETLSFERVLVVEGGRIVEDGVPARLAATASRYRELLDAENAVRSDMWKSSQWRRLRLEDGRLEAPGSGHREERAPQPWTAERDPGDVATAWRTSNRRAEPAPQVKKAHRSA